MTPSFRQSLLPGAGESFYKKVLLILRQIIVISENVVTSIKLCSYVDKSISKFFQLLSIVFKIFFNESSFFFKVLLETVLFLVEM